MLGGLVQQGEGFVPALKDYCLQNGIVFVDDEVQTGIGRTGRWFGIEHEDVVPDVVEAAVAHALRQGCRVETFSEDGALAGLGGIGALLRF